MLSSTMCPPFSYFPALPNSARAEGTEGGAGGHESLPPRGCCGESGPLARSAAVAGGLDLVPLFRAAMSPLRAGPPLSALRGNGALTAARRRAPVPTPGMAAGGFGSALVSSAGDRERAHGFPYSPWPPRGPGSGRGLEVAGSPPGRGRRPRSRRRPAGSRCRSARRSGGEPGPGCSGRRARDPLPGRRAAVSRGRVLQPSVGRDRGRPSGLGSRNAGQAVLVARARPVFPRCRVFPSPTYPQPRVAVVGARLG